MRTAAIVGAGFSGTMTCVHLLRRAMRGLPSVDRIVLFERSGRFTAGVAYGTRDHRHLLNVPAGRMSAFDDDPDNFLRWARARDAKVTGGSFIARRIYGEYLASLLRDTEAAAAAANAPISLERVGDSVERVTPSPDGSGERWTVRTGSGREHEASSVVLAIGNFQPSAFLAGTQWETFARSGRYSRDPWSPEALSVEPDDDVLILGTGLTMADMIVTLRSRGHRGRVWAISRRGLLPQAHRHSPTAPPAYPRPSDIERWPRTALGLLRSLRGEVDRASEEGIDWREVITSIRHDTQALWLGLPPEERRRFLRVLRPFWETHRHRSSPDTAAHLDAMIGEGRLRVLAGRVIALRETGTEGAGGAVEVGYRPRGESTERSIRVARVINCTGPDTDLSRVDEPLVVSLRNDGLIRPDALGLGLDSDDAGTIVDAQGRARAGLRIVGPLRKGRLWENTAVPELRGEAERMAAAVAGAEVRIGVGESRAPAGH